MKSQRFEDPRLFVVKTEELPLSGSTLLELMRAVLQKGVPFRFRAKGWSMTPFIRNGDVVTVAPLDDKPRIGEVVAFIHPQANVLIVHRIIGKNGTNFFIQGDSLAARTDGYIPYENLLGKVTSVERDGRVIKLGLGPERWLIALLSRIRLLIPLRELLVSMRNNFS